MSDKLATAISMVSRGREAGNSRKEMINNMANVMGVSTGYASTLYNSARKVLDGANAAVDAATPATAPTLPTKPSQPRAPKTIPAPSKTTQFTRGNLDMIQRRIDEALKSVGKEFGITIDTGNIRFSANQFTTKITAQTGDGSDAARELWDRYCWREGLNSEDFGKEFTTTAGDRFKIVGWKPKGKKYNVIAERVSDSKSYKFGASTVKRALAMEK